MKDFDLLIEKLGINFSNRELLRTAFCHRSFLNEHPEFKEHNERLEFLGDAVLELVVTEYLFEKYPEKPEGELTNWRASLVNAKTLSEMASELGFNDWLLLSRGEQAETGKARLYILGDVAESFIGAFYLDQGYDICKEFILKHLLIKLPRIIRDELFRDPKSYFQEQAQEKVKITPTYEVLEESGPDHNKKFEVGVFLDEEVIAKGIGSSKQEAEEAAAKKAIKIRKW